MENTFAFITNEYKTQHFFFQNYSCRFCFLVPQFHFSGRPLKKHLACVLHTVLFPDKPLFIKKIYIFPEKQNHSPDGLTKKAEKKKCRFRMMGIACSVNLRRA